MLCRATLVFAFGLVLGLPWHRPLEAQNQTGAPETADQQVAVPAPTRLYQRPPVYLLLRLSGDLTEFRYTPGSLDRSARLQTRLELAGRAFRKWAKKVEMIPEVFVLGHEEWRGARYPVPYGVPIRLQGNGLAVPAIGDDHTVALWSELLDGTLPSILGTPIRSTPQQAATMLLADQVAQILVSEMLVDTAGLGGNRPWVRGFATHVVSLGVASRIEPGRLRELDTMYALLERHRPAQGASARDYGPDLPFDEWLWFQGQFHHGAKLLLQDAGNGNDAVKRLRKLRKRGDGVLRDDLLLARVDGLRDWFATAFSAVSVRTR